MANEREREWLRRYHGEKIDTLPPQTLSIELLCEYLAAYRAEQVARLRPWLRHTGRCLVGSNRCTCGHHGTQHFMDQRNKPCAHCACRKFTNGECTCGLALALGSGEEKKRG